MKEWCFIYDFSLASFCGSCVILFLNVWRTLVLRDIYQYVGRKCKDRFGVMVNTQTVLIIPDRVIGR